MQWMWIIAVCAGCRREQITVYRIPKDSENPQTIAQSQSSGNDTLPSGHPSMTGAGASVPIKYDLPSGWHEKPPTGMSMMLFSMADNKAELSVMTFPKEAASQLNLINIIRDSAGLPPLSDADLAKYTEPVTVGGEKGSLFDLSAGTSTNSIAPTNRVLVAVLPHEGMTWFFKLYGQADAVTAQKAAFITFLNSVKFEAGGAPTPQFANNNSSAVPPNSLPGDDTGSSAEKLAWSVPASWKEVPPTQMLLAKFVISANDGEADVTVSEFPGEVGGLLQNVNRWRNQVGLAPVDSAGLAGAGSPLDLNGDKATLVDVNGTSPKTGKETRLIGVIWPRNGQTWFYKMMGDSAVAGREKEPFLKFIQSVRYPNA